jgi:hypothetical protein
MWRTQVDRAVEDNDELEEYIRGIEMQMDADGVEHEGVMLGDDIGPELEPGLDAGGAADLADEVEQFLREQGPPE